MPPTQPNPSQVDPPASSGNSTTVGNISNSQGVAIGPGAIAQVFQQVLLPAPSDYRYAALRMIEEYEEIFGGREAELAALNAFLLRDDQPYALLLAPTGRGKTALLIHWIARVQQRGEWIVIFTPISIRFGTAEERATLGALAHGLAALYDETERLKGLALTPDLMRPLIAEWLRREPPSNRRLLLVLDGMDEAIGWQVRKELFPKHLPPRVKVIVSARQMGHLSPADWLDDLGWRTKRTAFFNLEPLEREAVADILRHMGNPLDALATNIDLLQQIERVSTGDPLTIRLLVEALRDKEVAAEALPPMPPGLEPFMRHWLDELERKSVGQATVQVLLGLCAIALGPLTADDLAQLDPERCGVRASLNQAVKAVGRFVMGDGTTENGYVFSHSRLRELYLERVLSAQERTILHQRFVTCGTNWYQQHLTALAGASPTPANINNHCPDYLRRFWIMHLANAGEWTQISKALTSIVHSGERCVQPWAEMRLSAEGGYAGYLADLERLWRYTEQQADLAQSLRCVLIVASIRSLSGNLTPELLVRLVTVGTPQGKWSSAAALEYVRHMPDPHRQQQALQVLLESGCEISYELTLEIIQAMSDETCRAFALAKLAPYLSVDLLPQVLAAVRAIRDVVARSYALESPIFQPNTPEEYDIYVETFAAIQKVADERKRGEALSIIISHLPTNLVPQAIATACEINDELLRSSILMSLIRCLNDKTPHEVLNAARSISNPGKRAKVFSVLARHICDGQQREIYSEAFTTTLAISNQVLRSYSLSDLIPDLPHDMLPQALMAARVIDDMEARSRVLIEIAPCLLVTQESNIWTEVLETARTIPDGERRADALSKIAPNLPMDQRNDVYIEALTALSSPHMLIASNDRYITESSAAAWQVLDARLDAGMRIEAIANILPYLPKALLPQALVIAREIPYKRNRAIALSKVAFYLPTDQQNDVYFEAIATAQQSNIPDEASERYDTNTLSEGVEDSAYDLGALAPQLPITLFPCLLEAVRAIMDGRTRAHALASIAPYLPADQQPDLYAEAMIAASTIADRRSQVDALTALMPYLLADQQITIYTIGYGAACVITDPKERGEALISLAHYLPTNQQAGAYTEALAAIREISYPEKRAYTLIALIPQLPFDLCTIALTDAHIAAHTIPYAQERAYALAELAQHMPVDEQTKIYAEVLIAARQIPDDAWQAMALTSFTPHLPVELLDQVLDAARTITNTAMRAGVLIALTSRMLVIDQTDVYAKALSAARAIEVPADRAQSLIALIPYTPENQQADLCAEALVAAHANSGTAERATSLALLAAHLPADQRVAVYDEACTVACAITDPEALMFALFELAPALPAAMLQPILTLARNIDDPEKRAECLVRLIPHLPATQQAEICSETLTATNDIDFLQSRVDVMVELVPYLPNKLLPEAFLATCALPTQWARIAVLTAFVPRLVDITRVSLASTSTMHHLRQSSYRGIRTLAAYGRPDFLSSLAVLTSWLTVMTSAEVSGEVADSIIEVLNCWP